jgi:hypothetical protein
MTEPIPAPSSAASVILDIGGAVGALILHTPPHLNGVEIEISLNGRADAPRTHSRVRERRASTDAAYAAVYPGLPAGVYTIWRDATTSAATVTITGGHVTSTNWPAEPACGPARPYAGAGTFAPAIGPTCPVLTSRTKEGWW